MGLEMSFPIPAMHYTPARIRHTAPAATDHDRAWANTVVTVDVESLIRSCLPMGDACAPQAVADAIREWFDSLPYMEECEHLHERAL